jgi:hypothetical protein
MSNTREPPPRSAELHDKLYDALPVRESRHVVLALMKADEIEVAVEWLREQELPGAQLRIQDHDVYYRIDAEEGFSFDLDAIQERLGRPYNVYDFLVNVATTIGRAYVSGNTFSITTDLIGWEREVPR